MTEEICALMAFCGAPAHQPVREVLGGQMHKLFVSFVLALHLWSWWENGAHKLDVQQLFSDSSNLTYLSVELGCVGGCVCHGKSVGAENNPRKLILTFPLCRSQVSRLG